MFIVAMIILGVLIFLLTGERSPFSKDQMVYTYMEDAAALASGAPVRLNGIHVGRVQNVTLSGDRTHERNVKIAMAIESNRMKDIPVDSEAAISAENVLGTKFINIKQGRADTTVHDGSEIKALDTAEFEEVVQQSYTLLASLQGIIKRVDRIVGLVESGQGSIGKLLVDDELYSHVVGITRDFRKVSAAMASQQGTVGKLIYDDTLYTDMRTTLGRLDALVADLNAGKGTAGKLLKDDALYEEARQTVASVHKTVDNLNAGKGTAGKLLNSDDLHDQLKAMLAKIDLMIDKLNAGQGTVGQLLVNRQLYDNLTGATAEARDLLKDIRSNPKKFLRIKLGLF
jgi:phospholipid/cholesterol/gamma-HCH transport system substrate-binding protein